MKFINEKDYNNLSIYNHSIINKMNTNLKQSYYEMYSVYYNFFLKYLLKNTRIKEIDDMLASSSLAFPKIDENNMDVYQDLSSEYLKYFYVRNNMNVENLSAPERKFIYNRLASQNYEYDMQTEEFIKKTFPKVITEPINNEGKPILINFGPISENFLAHNGVIVIGVRYDEFNDKDLTDKEWGERHSKQMEELNKIIPQLGFNIEDKINYPCSIIKYNEYSIKKRFQRIIAKE